MERTVGVIGLGIMGSAMGGNLIEAGFRIVGFDVRREAIDALVAQGGEAAPSARAVADETQIVITSMANIAAFHDVVSGADGLAHGDAKGLVVICGMKDILVVRTKDAVLVIPRKDAERVKEVVARLEELGCSDYL